MKSFLLFNLFAFANCLQQLPSPDIEKVYKPDRNTMKVKHFCEGCESTKANALRHSQQRNEHFWTRPGSKTVATNTVFMTKYNSLDYKATMYENEKWWEWENKESGSCELEKNWKVPSWSI